MPNTPEQDKMLAFVKAYWLSKPDPLRAFQKMQNTLPDGTQSPERGDLAITLTQQGYDIDLPIMVWDWNPSYVMLVRENEGVVNPLYLNGNVIKVSSRIEDYPPFDPPVPPPPVDARLVGNYAGFANLYFSTEAGKAVPDGTNITQDGVTYSKSVTHGVVGVTHLFKSI